MNTNLIKKVIAPAALAAAAVTMSACVPNAANPTPAHQVQQIITPKPPPPPPPPPAPVTPKEHRFVPYSSNPPTPVYCRFIQKYENGVLVGSRIQCEGGMG